MKIVIVCLEFARAQRMRSLAEGLTLSGHEVVFITSEPDANDSQFRVIAIPFRRTGTRVKAAAGLKASANLAEVARTRGRLAERLVRAAAHAYESLFQHPDRYRGWIGACKRWLRGHPPELAGADAIIASHAPATTLVVGSMLARHLGRPLVLDFRDLWTDNGSYRFRGLRRTVDQAWERRLVGSAVATTAAAPAFATALQRRYPQTRATTIYTGIDVTPWQATAPRTSDGTLRFGHFGVWYAGRRTIRPLLESVRRLTAGGGLDPARVEVHMYGHTDGSVTRDAEDTQLADSLRVHGWVEPSDVPGAIQTVDIALLLAWPEDISSVPLKTYHYLAAGKTILVLGAHPGSEMRRMLEPLPGVDCPDTPAELDTCVSRYWEMAQARADFSWSLDQRPMPVTRESMTAQFLEVIRQAASDQ